MKMTFSHELYKMVHQRSSWVAMVALCCLMAYSATPTAYITKNLVAQGFGVGQWSIIIMIALTANFFTMELRNNTMTTLLYKSPSRSTVFLAKFFVLIIYGFWLVLIGFLFALIIKIGLVGNQFSWQIVYHQHPLINDLLLNLLGVAVYLIFTTALTLLLIALFKSSAVVIVIGLFIGFLGANFSGIAMQAFLHFQKIITWNPLNMINVINQLSDAGMNKITALTDAELVIGNLVYAAIFLFIGLIVFRKSDL
ncbi:MAG TPA: ABC transporter permease [Candidatus Limosilactobacillus excrementigallinarum]|nr:ABC transporter permease [Candidatus Limosilactobacillus excrementigallinarum]